MGNGGHHIHIDSCLPKPAGSGGRGTGKPAAVESRGFQCMTYSCSYMPFLPKLPPMHKAWRHHHHPIVSVSSLCTCVHAYVQWLCVCAYVPWVCMEVRIQPPLLLAFSTCYLCICQASWFVNLSKLSCPHLPAHHRTTGYKARCTTASSFPWALGI